MIHEHQGEYQTRLAKLHALKKAGLVPYANRFDKKHSIQELHTISKNEKLSEADTLLTHGSKQVYSTAGRMMTFRTHGKLSFATLRDATGDIQVAFVKNLCSLHTGVETTTTISIEDTELTSYKFVEKYCDIGDFIGVKGDLFITKHGELTLFVDEYQLLSKAIRPLGDKRHGIKDEEKIYRQRYLDMTMNTQSYERFLFKTKFYDALRGFYKSQGFEEIVTSILGNSASGAAARPFKTHHNDYDLDVFLRIAFEPGLKMATVGRYEKVFEIGKDFRNEGSDPSHLQEFTQVEHYAAYRNFEDNMLFTESMFEYIFDTLKLDKKIPIKDKEGNVRTVDRSTPRQRIDYIKGVKEASGGIDISQYTADDADSLREEIKAKGHQWVGIETQGTTALIDYLYKKVLRPGIIGPAFVYNYPKTMQPLARQSDANPEIVEQYQVVVNGREIIKAYSELVDPTIQKANFEEQAIALEAGDEEATSSDDDFLLAMEHGMPPQSGFGMGLERILALLTGQDNLRDVVMFPLMKPENNAHSTNKETNIAVALINQEANLELWQQMNTIAHLSASLGGREGKKLFTQDTIQTNDNVSLQLNIQDAIMIKEISSNESIRQLRKKATEANLQITEFTKEMLETTDDKKIVTTTKNIDFNEIQYCGFLIYGKKSIVESITKQYPLINTPAKNNTPKKGTLHEEKTVEEKVTPTDNNPEMLVEKYLSDTKRHCRQVGHVMREFAKKLGEDQEYWYTVGLLHDVDWDYIQKNPEQHLGESFEKIVAEIGMSEDMINDIRSHYEETGVPVDSLIRKYLASVDELSGLLYAYSLMRPEGFEGMKRKSINKKVKDKAFASGVNREHVRYCEKYLEIPLSEFSLQVVEALKSF